MRIFSFESKRLIKKKTTRVMLILSILAVTIIYLLHFNLAEQVQKKVTNHYDFLIDLYQQDQSKIGKSKRKKHNKLKMKKYWKRPHLWKNMLVQRMSIT